MRLTDTVRFERIGDGENYFFCRDNREALPGLIQRFGGQVQMAYIDPPFCTGRDFMMRLRVGEEGYRMGKPFVLATGYSDKLSTGEYMDMMERVVRGIHDMLDSDGSFFLHVDSRAHARLRLLCDDVFGEANFINDIVWAYRSGGRGVRAFAKKHDNILFYRKSKNAFFDIRAVAMPREAKPRENHMKSGVDESGREYKSIVSAGKEYRYYADEPVFPSDVWTDIPHIQQKDPVRTGYETQKPEKLLERMILSTTRPGDIVLDLFAGSGTSLCVAEKLGRRFIGVDESRFSLFATRKRVSDVVAEVFGGGGEIGSSVRYRYVDSGAEVSVFGVDEIDGWGAGVIIGDCFHLRAREDRTEKNPAITGTLKIPVGEGERICARVTDYLGRDFYFIADLFPS